MSDITVSKEKLQKLLDNFYEMCNICDELDIYEHNELDEYMQEARKEINEIFERKITKTNY